MSKPATIVGLLLALLVTASAGAEEATKPPTHLRQLPDGHWTPWDPPAAGPGDYLIEKDDTLWDLAGKWLDDPFLWPQIWDVNRYILDSHWIYPRDPLVIPGRPVVVPPGGPPEPVVQQPPQAQPEPIAQLPQPVDPGPVDTPGPTPAPVAVPQPAPLLPVAAASDVYCSGYIESARNKPELRIVGHHTEKIGVAEGDVVYLDRGRSQGMQVGAQWAIIRHTGRVKHPATGDRLGRYVRRLGRLRVLAVQSETAMAVIEMSCEDIHDGDGVVPWADIPIPRLASVAELEPLDVEPSGGLSGYIVALRDDITAVGEGHVIHIDLGENAGVRPGDLFKLYRDNGDLPRTVLGQAVVLTVESGTSTAKVTASARESAIGDRVEEVR